MDVVRNILLSHMIGEEWPRPGIAAFQTMFLSTPHSAGRFFSSETPLLCGPRHCGQFVASPRDCANTLKPPAATTANNSARVKFAVFIFSLSVMTQIFLSYIFLLAGSLTGKCRRGK